MSSDKLGMKTTFTSSVADMERCAGKCKTAAEALKDNGGDQNEVAYLSGAFAAIYALLSMEFGDNCDTFLNRLTYTMGGNDESE